MYILLLILKIIGWVLLGLLGLVLFLLGLVLFYPVCYKMEASYYGNPEAKEAILSEENGWKYQWTDFDAYMREYNPVVLRWSISSKLPETKQPLEIRNIGVSKGATYNHVIILCTDPFKKFVKDGTIPTSEKTKSELYVAITRARYSVAFVYDHPTYRDVFKLYNPTPQA